MSTYRIHTLSAEYVLFLCVVGACYSLPISENGSTSGTLGLAGDSLLVRAMDCYYRVNYDSALFLFRRSEEVFSRAESWEKCARCFNLIGDTYSRKLALDSMDASLRCARAIEIHWLEEDNLERAQTCSLLGLLHTYREDFDSAIIEIERGKRIRQKILGDDNRAVGASNFLLGFSYCSMGRYSQAVTYAKEALRVFGAPSDGDNFDIVNTLTLCGGIYQRQGNWAQALSYFSEARALVLRSGDEYKDLAAYCEYCLGWCLSDLGCFPEALVHLRNSEERLKQIHGDWNPFLAGSYLEMGEVMLELGDSTRALDYFRLSLKLEKRSGRNQHSSEANIEGRIARACQQSDNLDEALAMAKEALRLYQKRLGREHPSIGDPLEVLGGIYVKRGEFSAGLRMYNRALALRQRTSDTTGNNNVARILCEIASVYSRMHYYTRSLELYHKALDLDDRLPVFNKIQQAEAIRGIGHIWLERKHYAQALRCFQKAIYSVCPELHDNSTLANPRETYRISGKEILDLLIEKAEAFQKMYDDSSHNIADLQSGLETYRAASTILEALRKKYYSEASKLIVGDQCHSLYEEAISLSMRLLHLAHHESYREDAFWFSEHSKSNVLLDGILDAQARKYGGVPDSLIEREKSLRASIDHFETELQKESQDHHGTEKVLNLQDTCFVLNSLRDDLLKRAELTYPRYFDLKYRSGYRTPADIRKELDDSTLIVEYAIGKSNLVLIVLSKDRFETKEVRLPPSLNGMVQSLNSSVKLVDEEAFVSAGRQLYDLLIGPIRKVLSRANHVVIIPDGVLYTLPFECLLASNPPRGSVGVDFAAAKYLVQEVDISYAYTASFYIARAREASERDRRPKTFVGFAPVFADSDGAKRNNRNADRTGALWHELRSVTVDRREFCELKFSEEEVKSIEADFKGRGLRAHSFVHKEATEENFKQFSGEYDCVHVATHGFIDDEHPALSMLLFAPPGISPGPEDGILFTGETYNLDLRADLVVLSCCECGTGKLVKGEGVMALTRGFFYSGAKNVLLSHWKVYDRQASKLMRAFYSEILRGRSYHSALRLAKLKMISKEVTAFPLNWAGFVLFGS